MASRRISIRRIIKSIGAKVEHGNCGNNIKLNEFLQKQFKPIDFISFHFCDEAGLIDFLDLGEQSKDSLMDEYGLIDKAEVAILLADHNTQDGKRKIELVQKILELELFEVELMLKPYNDKFNLGLSESYLQDLESRTGTSNPDHSEDIADIQNGIDNISYEIDNLSRQLQNLI